MSHRSGILFVLSAPSGGGKSTLLKWLAESGQQDFVYSVSCTTRAPRPGEVDGKDYHFLSGAEFERRVAAGEFLEHASVHGNRYGTLRRTVTEALDAGGDLLMDVDIQGAAQIRANADARMRSALVDVFLMPPSMTELERRLRHRATETPEQLALRLKNAEGEMAQWRHYRYAILSGKPADDFENFRAVMRAERMRSERLALQF
jgi:guanylate kinase